MATPEEIKVHASKYKEGTWKKYTYEELAQWVNLLTKRAAHRSDVHKAYKDLDDANNYLAIMKAKFAEESENIINSFQKEE